MCVCLPLICLSFYSLSIASASVYLVIYLQPSCLFAFLSALLCRLICCLLCLFLSAIVITHSSLLPCLFILLFSIWCMILFLSFHSSQSIFLSNYIFWSMYHLLACLYLSCLFISCPCEAFCLIIYPSPSASYLLLVYWFLLDIFVCVLSRSCPLLLLFSSLFFLVCLSFLFAYIHLLFVSFLSFYISLSIAHGWKERIKVFISNFFFFKMWLF